MDISPSFTTNWLPLIMVVVAFFGWTYKLSRDIRSDFKADLADAKREILADFRAHVHDSESGEIFLRALAGK